MKKTVIILTTLNILLMAIISMGIFFAACALPGSNRGAGAGINGTYWGVAGSSLFYNIGNVGIGTRNPQAKLHVDGTIKSSMWKVTQLFNSEKGPLPKSKTFTTGGGTLLIFASGSGYRNVLEHIGMGIEIDSEIRGYAKVFTNEASSHKAFTTNSLVVTGIKAGAHTITLTQWNGTITNGQHDFFNVTVLELPF